MIYSCREVSRLVSESLDRKLTLKERIGLRIHLFICEFCRRYEKQIAFLHRVLHMEYDPALLCCPDDADKARLPDETRERIKSLMQASLTPDGLNPDD